MNTPARAAIRHTDNTRSHTARAATLARRSARALKHGATLTRSARVATPRTATMTATA